MKARLLRNGRWFYLAVALVASFVAGFLARERALSNERLFNQTYVLARIARDAMLYRATPERIAAKIETELKTRVEAGYRSSESADSPAEYVVVLPSETGLLGMGGRWILHLRIGKDGRCDQAWTEMQPVGVL